MIEKVYYLCSICKSEHETAEEAIKCETKGSLPCEFIVGEEVETIYPGDYPTIKNIVYQEGHDKHEPILEFSNYRVSSSLPADACKKLTTKVQEIIIKKYRCPVCKKVYSTLYEADACSKFPIVKSYEAGAVLKHIDEVVLSSEIKASFKRKIHYNIYTMESGKKYKELSSGSLKQL